MAFTNKHLSYGESCLRSILEDNNVGYRKEYSIINKEGGHQRIDFYIVYEGKGYAIEYMGKQHYVQSTGTWKTPLETIQKRDRLKIDYCKKEGIEILAIPYTKTGKKEIFTELKEFLPFKIEYKNDRVEKYIKGITDIKEFELLYYNYEIKEVAKKLNLTSTQVEYYAKINNLNKQKVKVDGMNMKTGEIIRFNSIREASEHVKSSGVRGCLRRTRKTSKGWIFKYNEESFNDWSNRITDYRIKAVTLEREDTYITLPLGLVNYELGMKKSSVVEVAKGQKKSVYGYDVRYATDEEREKCFDKYSYIYYLKHKE